VLDYVTIAVVAGGHNSVNWE